MGNKRVTERVVRPFTGCTVNRESGTIDDVLICGTESANGRDYPVSVFKRDYGVYEGRPVNCDHGREATVDRRFGWFTNVRPGPDGRPRGTLNALKSHPMYERVMEAAERNPALFGFSHVAMCDTRRGSNGREVVEAIKSVESIDLVAEPATTKGFFEGKGVNRISLKQFSERFGPKMAADRRAALTKLCEELGDMAAGPVMDEPAPDVDEGDLKSALIAALAPFLDDAFETGNSDKAAAALRDFVKMHAKHTGGDKSEPPADDTKKDDDMPKESRPQPWDVLRECQAQDYTPTATELEVLAGVTSAEKRKAFVTEQKAKAANAAAQKPQSAARTPGASAAGKTVTESKFPATAAEFAASIRN